MVYKSKTFKIPTHFPSGRKISKKLRLKFKRELEKLDKKGSKS